MSRIMRTRCSDPTSHHSWTSEHEKERAVAVLCEHCPVLTVCRDTTALRKESCLGYTNAESGENISFPSNGSVQRITFNEDGTQTVQATGHNVVILFPTDVPAGPSTTLYTGRLVYTDDGAGNFTVQSTSGPTTDICALLA